MRQRESLPFHSHQREVCFIHSPYKWCYFRLREIGSYILDIRRQFLTEFVISFFVAKIPCCSSHARRHCRHLVKQCDATHIPFTVYILRRHFIKAIMYLPRLPSAENGGQ